MCSPAIVVARGLTMTVLVVTWLVMVRYLCESRGIMFVKVTVLIVLSERLHTPKKFTRCIRTLLVAQEWLAGTCYDRINLLLLNRFTVARAPFTLTVSSTLIFGAGTKGCVLPHMCC